MCAPYASTNSTNGEQREIHAGSVRPARPFMYLEMRRSRTRGGSTQVVDPAAMRQNQTALPNVSLPVTEVDMMSGSADRVSER